ncbi:MAG: biotin synthase BioB, partial [bacterium]|nr:biotin synthase BioB [bacterium]
MEKHYKDCLTKTPITELLNTAFLIRERHFGNQVTIHIINNAQNGHCPEDCSYCAQAKTADSKIETYGLKPAEEMLEEATRAYEQGAHRYCMVLSGRGPTPTKINQITDVIRTIKRKHPDKEVCLSAGLLNDGMAVALQQAGLDRLNHNINTSEDNYSEICTTHTYMDRINTLNSAQKAGLSLCSGVIVGMGESHDELIAMALKLKSLNVRSIPINFLIPVP